PVHVRVSPGHTCSRNWTPNRRTSAAPSQSVAYVARMPAWSIPTENTVGNPAPLAYSSSWWIGLKSPDAPWYRTKSLRVSGPKSRGSAFRPSVRASAVPPLALHSPPPLRGLVAVPVGGAPSPAPAPPPLGADLLQGAHDLLPPPPLPSLLEDALGGAGGGGFGAGGGGGAGKHNPAPA